MQSQNEKKISKKKFIEEITKLNTKDLRQRYEKILKEKKDIEISNKTKITKKQLIILLSDLIYKKNSNIKIKSKKNPENGLILLQQGKRDNMEDTYTIWFHDDLKLYAVFDGHGGEEVSEFLTNILPKKIYQNIDLFLVNYRDTNIIEQLINKIFISIDNEIKNLNLESGSTCVATLQIKDHLYIINLGDSRGILYYYNVNSKGYKIGKLKVQHITDDHKPDNASEFQYIKQAGGRVEYDKEDESYRVDGYLAMSRAFGDFDLKYSGNLEFNGPVSVKPDIYHTKLHKNRKYYIILASDGLWDEISNKRCLGYLDKFDTKIGCQYLMRESLEKSWDNITILTAILK